MILVACALRAELAHLRRTQGIVVLETGVGPVEAAAATARELARVPYRAVVNAGIGGAFRGSARVGEALLVVEEALADFGLEGGARLVLPGGATLADRERADPGLVAAIAPGIPRGCGLTVASVTTTDATATRLRGRYRADVESMEGFAVLRSAALARVPAIEIRGISNYVGERARSEWDFEAGARATAHALDAILDQLIP